MIEIFETFLSVRIELQIIILGIPVCFYFMMLSEKKKKNYD